MVFISKKLHRNCYSSSFCCSRNRRTFFRFSSSFSFSFTVAAKLSSCFFNQTLVLSMKRLKLFAKSTSGGKSPDHDDVFIRSTEEWSWFIFSSSSCEDVAFLYAWWKNWKNCVHFWQRSNLLVYVLCALQFLRMNKLLISHCAVHQHQQRYD